MAFRIESAVIRGEISNREQGVVTGKVWLAGRTRPLLLNLRGNCLRDLAGCELRFNNPRPVADSTLQVLAPTQNGVTGDMTASRKVRQPTVSEAELIDLISRDEHIPFRVANSLYLEWYSEENGRVVIEASDYTLNISPPHWSMSPEEEHDQLANSHHHFHQFIDAITGDADEEENEEEAADSAEAFPGAAEDLDEEEEEDKDEEDDSLLSLDPLDEFEWEQELRDADRRTEAYHEAFEKYRDHPDRERLIAEALGWEIPEDAEESVSLVELGLSAADPAEWEDDAMPETHHPLSQRAMDFALTLQREAEERGLMGENAETRDSPILTLILHIISLGGKLAGALDDWAQGGEPEPGLIIAMLKRAQVPLNEALHAFDFIDASSLDEETHQWLTSRKHDLFELRREIIDLMHLLRTT